MQPKIVAVFALGVAAGMAVLAIGLWSTGHLVGYHQDVALAAPSLPESAFRPAPIPRANRADPVLPELPGAESAGSANRLPDGLPHLAMPLANVDPAKLTSTFWQARNGHIHEALDIMAKRGTPVFAVADGAVAKLFTSKQGGLTVYQFDTTQRWCYYYAHLDRYESSLNREPCCGKAMCSATWARPGMPLRMRRTCTSPYFNWGPRNGGGKGRRWTLFHS